MSVASPPGPWVELGPVERIPRRGACVVDTSYGPIAVFRTGDGRVFALDDRCPHQGGPLSEGLVHGHRVTCPLHETRVCLESGQCDGPSQERVTVHAVRVEGGRVFLAPPSWPLSGSVRA
ncbi:MAG: nitrite reductase small subunit NirD [Myxococcales bacterium]